MRRSKETKNSQIYDVILRPILWAIKLNIETFTDMNESDKST